MRGNGRKDTPLPIRFPLDAGPAGEAELIWTLAHVYLKQGVKAAIIGPTFGEYRATSLAVGATKC